MITQYLTSAAEIAREAGDKAKELVSRSAIQYVKEQNDPVTDGDLLVDTFVFDAIKRNYPAHGFISEERGQSPAESEFVWILDPIDGSKYYAKGVPLYSVSLALQQKEKLVLGVVYIPETDQMFCAATGEGSTLNGREIRCSSSHRLEDCTVCLEIPSTHSSVEEREWAQSAMGKLIGHVQRVRILGVGSIGLCYCAMGGFDLYVNLGSSWKYWDIAAGKVILESAGGICPLAQMPIIAGPRDIARKVRELLELPSG